MIQPNFVITRRLSEAADKNADILAAVNAAVSRFCNEDWGNIDQEDKEANKADLTARDGHVLARYETPAGDIYINLEFLLPEENIACIMFCEEY